MAGQTVSLLSPLTTADTASTVVNKINTDLSSLAVELARKVTPGDMLVTSDLSMVGHYLTETAGVVLEDTGLSPSGLGTVYYSGGDFWLVTSGGAVQITKSGAVNVASAGGINGDYPGASGATVTYTHSTLTYTFMDSASAWANLKGLGYYIINAGLTASTKLASACTTNGTWSFCNLPVTSAGVFHLVTVDSAGTMKVNDTVDAAVTFNAGFTAAADQKHTDSWSGRLNVCDALLGATVTTSLVGEILELTPVSTTWVARLYFKGLRVGDKVTTASCKVIKNAAATVTLDVNKVNLDTGAVTNVLTGSSATASGTVTITASTGTPAAIAANEEWFVKISSTAGDQTLGSYDFRFSYTHP